MTRDEVLSLSPEQVNRLVCGMMEQPPTEKTIAELRESCGKDWSYSTFHVKTPGWWWKAEIGTETNLVNGIYQKITENFKAHWTPDKFPAFHIEDAWEVLEKMKSEEVRWIVVECANYSWRVTVYFHDQAREYIKVMEDTAQLAICRAFLLAVMGRGLTPVALDAGDSPAQKDLFTLEAGSAAGKSPKPAPRR